MVRNHRYIPRAGEGLEDIGDDATMAHSSEDAQVWRIPCVSCQCTRSSAAQVFQKYDRLLHGTYSKREKLEILTTGHPARALAPHAVCWWWWWWW